MSSLWLDFKTKVPIVTGDLMLCIEIFEYICACLNDKLLARSQGLHLYNIRIQRATNLVTRIGCFLANERIKNRFYSYKNSFSSLSSVNRYIQVFI